MKYKFKLSNISKLGLGCWGLGGDSYGKLNEQSPQTINKI